jgi:hypothetical protein
MNEAEFRDVTDGVGRLIGLLCNDDIFEPEHNEELALLFAEYTDTGERAKAFTCVLSGYAAHLMRSALPGDKDGMVVLNITGDPSANPIELGVLRIIAAQANDDWDTAMDHIVVLLAQDAEIVVRSIIFLSWTVQNIMKETS